MNLKPILQLLFVTFALSSTGQNSNHGDQHHIINRLLTAYNSGNIDSIRSFIQQNYLPAALKKEGAMERISFSFGSLYDEFGPLELFSDSFDSTYQAPKYFLRGKYTKEWVAILIVPGKQGDKIAGHGVFKLQSPEGTGYNKIPVKKLPGHLDAHLAALSDNNLFSGSVLVAHKNKVIFNKAFGLKNRTERVTVNTKMPIASVTKLFTGIAISQLVNRGLIAVSDPVSRFIPEYPADISGQVTVRHLLLHLSGIELDDCRPYLESLPSARNLDELIKLHATYIDSLNEGRRNNFKPLNRFDYSNEEYHLLGAIIERVSKTSFEDYILNNICIPLGLKNTNFGADTGVFGFSHYDELETYQPGRWFTYPHRTPELKSPSGGLFSTTGDLYQLYQSLSSKKLFSKDWRDVLSADTTTSGSKQFYGYGIEGSEIGSYLTYGHNGGTIQGVNAEFRYLPKEDLFIAIICNRGRTASDLLYYLLNRLQF